MTGLLIVTAADLVLLRLLGRHPVLERELERAVAVSSEAVPPDVVTMNSAIYTDETQGVRRFVKIVYPHAAAADDGRISVLSPVGSALLGLSAGKPSSGTSRTAAGDACGWRRCFRSPSAGCARLRRRCRFAVPAGTARARHGRARRL